MNMDRKNHLMEKENKIFQTSVFGFDIFIFQGVIN